MTLEITAASSGTLNATYGRNYGVSAGISSIGNRDNPHQVYDYLILQELGDITINGEALYWHHISITGAEGIGSSEYNRSTTMGNFGDKRNVNNITGIVNVTGGTEAAIGLGTNVFLRE